MTVKVIKKTQKHKNSGTKRTVTKTVQNDSFFNFFTPPEVTEGEEPVSWIYPVLPFKSPPSNKGPPPLSFKISLPDCMYFRHSNNGPPPNLTFSQLKAHGPLNGSLQYVSPAPLWETYRFTLVCH